MKNTYFHQQTQGKVEASKKQNEILIDLANISKLEWPGQVTVWNESLCGNECIHNIAEFGTFCNDVKH